MRLPIIWDSSYIWWEVMMMSLFFPFVLFFGSRLMMGLFWEGCDAFKGVCFVSGGRHRNVTPPTNTHKHTRAYTRRHAHTCKCTHMHTPEAFEKNQGPRRQDSIQTLPWDVGGDLVKICYNRGPEKRALLDLIQVKPQKTLFGPQKRPV